MSVLEPAAEAGVECGGLQPLRSTWFSQQVGQCWGPRVMTSMVFDPLPEPGYLWSWCCLGTLTVAAPPPLALRDWDELSDLVVFLVRLLH